MSDLFKKSPLWTWPRAAKAAAAAAAVTAALTAGAPVAPSTPAFSSLLPGLSPPYLFFAVHLIVVLIWKLSGKKEHSDDKPDEAKPPAAPPPPTGDPAPPSRDRSSDDESCVTADDSSADAGGENDSMDATWDAIMRGGASPVRRLLAENGPAAAARPAAGRQPDELNLRFEAFIKKHYEQMGAGGTPAMPRDLK